MLHALTRWVAWDARLSKVDDTGVAAREHFAAAAKRGNTNARQQLEGPPFPAPLLYLYQWYQELRRGLGSDMQGAAALSWAALDAWARWTGRDPEPHEVDALFTLDAVTRHPELVEAR